MITVSRAHGAGPVEWPAGKTDMLFTMLGCSHIKQTGPETAETSHNQIIFQVLEDGVLKKSANMILASDPSQVQRVALKYERKNFYLYNAKRKLLRPGQCVESLKACWFRGWS
jgi:hypothetical protein